MDTLEGEHLCLEDFFNRLVARSNLSSRGVALDSLNCPFRDFVVEDLEHCMFRCSLVLPIWRKNLELAEFGLTGDVSIFFNFRYRWRKYKANW